MASCTFGDRGVAGCFAYGIAMRSGAEFVEIVALRHCMLQRDNRRILRCERTGMSYVYIVRDQGKFARLFRICLRLGAESFAHLDVRLDSLVLSRNGARYTRFVLGTHK